MGNGCAEGDGGTTAKHEGSGRRHSSIEVDRRTGSRSLLTALVHLCIRPFKNTLVKPKRALPAGSNRLEVPRSVASTCFVRERRVEEIYCYDIRRKPSSAREGGGARDGIATEAGDAKELKRVYYFAGGGWQMPPNAQHWRLCAEMAEGVARTAVTLVSYPLAPNSPASDSFPALVRLYHALLRQSREAGETVVLAGDSAGGNIVLAVTLHALASPGQGAERLAPKALMCISPSTDLTRDNPAIREGEKHDPILTYDFIKSTAAGWGGALDPARDARISPMLADVSVMREHKVQVHGVTGSYDILGPDAVRFRDSLAREEVEGRWLEWEKQMHVFPLTFMYGVPEGRKGKDWIIETLRAV